MTETSLYIHVPINTQKYDTKLPTYTHTLSLYICKYSHIILYLCMHVCMDVCVHAYTYACRYVGRLICTYFANCACVSTTHVDVCRHEWAERERQSFAPPGAGDLSLSHTHSLSLFLSFSLSLSLARSLSLSLSLSPLPLTITQH